MTEAYREGGTVVTCSFPRCEAVPRTMYVVKRWDGKRIRYPRCERHPMMTTTDAYRIEPQADR